MMLEGWKKTDAAQDDLLLVCRRRFDDTGTADAIVRCLPSLLGEMQLLDEPTSQLQSNLGLKAVSPRHADNL